MAKDSDWLSRFLSALIHCAPSDVPTGNVRHDTPHEDATAPAAPERPAARAPTLSTSPITIAPILAPAVALGTLITPTLLHQLGTRNPDPWVSPIIVACAEHQIDTPLRIAAFLANVMVETSALSQLVESFNYSPEGLVKTWPQHFTQATAQALGRTVSKPANQRGIAETAYGGRLGNGPPGSGDGWLFRGRGLIQLTGRTNYGRFADRTGISIEALPDRLAAAELAAVSAAHFWQVAGCNELADREDIVAVRLAVNGGSIGLDKVRTLYQKARAALAVQ